MSNRNRDRGFELERETVTLAKQYNLEAQRARGSDGRSLGRQENVDLIIDDLSFQCKRVKTLAKKFVPEDNIFAQVFRQDGSKESFCLIRTKDLLSLLTNKK